MFFHVNNPMVGSTPIDVEYFTAYRNSWVHDMSSFDSWMVGWVCGFEKLSLQSCFCYLGGSEFMSKEWLHFKSWKFWAPCMVKLSRISKVLWETSKPSTQIFLKSSYHQTRFIVDYVKKKKKIQLIPSWITKMICHMDVPTSQPNIPIRMGDDGPLFKIFHITESPNHVIKVKWVHTHTFL